MNVNFEPIRVGRGAGRLMANTILNFHFDYRHPSLILSSFFHNTFSACHQRAICCLHSMTQICQIGTDRTCSPEKAKDALNKVSFLSESQEKVENCGHQTENGKLEAAT